MSKPQFLLDMEPYGALYTDMYAALLSKLEDLNDEQLVALRASSLKLTTTNCSWTIYAIAPLVRAEVNRILSVRSEEVPA